MKKVALITGASSGIGKELALIHAKSGGDLIVVARSKQKLLDLANELKEKYDTETLVIAKDLTNIESAKEIYTQVKSKGLSVDYLINNAGFGGLGYFHERNWEDDLAMINLNVTMLTALTRYFLPDMVKVNAGRILNISSTASLAPGPLQAVYFATKAYVTSLSNALAQELSNTNITVTALLPGATETEFEKVSGLEETALFSNPTSAYSVAKEGYDAMLSGKLDLIVGLPFFHRILMVLQPFLPKKVIMKQIFEMQKTN